MVSASKLATTGAAAAMLFFAAATTACRAAAAESVAAGWDALPALLASIQAPAFPDRQFAVADYGAVGDGKQDCHQAFAAAIEACHAAGGGRVVVPAGDWLVRGPIHLLSNVNVHLEKGATIRFSADAADYLPLVLTRFEGTELMNYSPLIYAFEQENIAVTGAGTLDGQAGPKNWWSWKGRGGPQQESAIQDLGRMADEGVPPAERVFGEGAQLRINFVQPYRCQNVLIEGVKFVNSPMWILNPVLCTNVTVRGVTVDSHGPNNDGCDPESCRRVLIEECLFDTGDDCIAIKSGRNADGRRVGVPSEEIVVRNCRMKDGHGGVVLGSEMSGGIRNVYVEDCEMDSPDLERAIRLKSNSRRGGYLENLFVRNVKVGEVSDAVIRINLEYWGETGDFPPRVRNVFIENVTSQKSNMPLYLVGLPERKIENVQLLNCEFKNAKKPSVLEHVEQLELRDVSQPRDE
ncbi:MAG: glycoside hydrolase family 28 protein [Planctomycetales bacterium]|nr:glycoside hydrolase family 28 protein [Planctomycetales bacterium]